LGDFAITPDVLIPRGDRNPVERHHLAPGFCERRTVADGYVCHRGNAGDVPGAYVIGTTSLSALKVAQSNARI
jgi:hypothetical protein